MASQTLAELRDRVRSWSNRKDLSDSLVTDFINIAQSRANRLLRIPVLEAQSTLQMQGTNEFVIPRDYVEAIQFKVDIDGRIRNLERKDIDFVEEQAHLIAKPNYFARRGTSFYIAPSQPSIVEATLYYYIAFPPLEEDTETNWFVADAPELLLYGALTELNLYLKNVNEAGQWESKFQNQLLEIQKMADDAQWSGSTLSISPSQG